MWEGYRCHIAAWDLVSPPVQYSDGEVRESHQIKLVQNCSSKYFGVITWETRTFTCLFGEYGFHDAVISYNNQLLWFINLIGVDVDANKLAACGAPFSSTFDFWCEIVKESDILFQHVVYTNEYYNSSVFNGRRRYHFYYFCFQFSILNFFVNCVDPFGLDINAKLDDSLYNIICQHTWHLSTAVLPDITYSSCTWTLYFWLTTVKKREFPKWIKHCNFHFFLLARNIFLKNTTETICSLWVEKHLRQHFNQSKETVCCSLFHFYDFVKLSSQYLSTMPLWIKTRWCNWCNCETTGAPTKRNLIKNLFICNLFSTLFTFIFL